MHPNLSAFLDGAIPVEALGEERDLRPSMRERARRLIALARREDPSWNPPPFDPLRIAEALGIPVTLGPTHDGCDAMLMPFPKGRFRIVCNPRSQSERRRAFSLAHELMHLSFSDVAEALRRRTVEVEETPEERLLERLCDAGASDLLMPHDVFGTMLQELGVCAAAVPALADRFAVSLEAAALRVLTCAGDRVAAVGFFHYARRPSARGDDIAREEVPTYRVRRVFAGRGTPYLFPRGKSVSRESVIYRCSLGNRQMEAIETFTLGPVSGTFRVSAFPLTDGEMPVGPPLVCALFAEPPSALPGGRGSDRGQGPG